jgi:D-aminopeptidase
LPESSGGWTVGALVQTNFGGVLQIAGAPVGVELGQYYMRSQLEGAPATPRDIPDGSCMIIVATDAPLDAAALERLALRAFMGMARTGASGSNGSGDYVIAFSTHPGLRQGSIGADRPRVAPLPTSALSPLFMAAIEASEEAIYNSLFAATSVTGPRGAVSALDVDATIEILRAHGHRD